MSHNLTNHLFHHKIVFVGEIKAPRANIFCLLYQQQIKAGYTKKRTAHLLENMIAAHSMKSFQWRSCYHKNLKNVMQYLGNRDKSSNKVIQKLRQNCKIVQCSNPLAMTVFKSMKSGFVKKV